MSLQNISVLGYTDQQSKFIIKSKDLLIKSVSCETSAYEYEPLEYLLAGVAACINVVGKQIAEEMNIQLKSIQIEITGQHETKKTEGKRTRSRSVFISISININKITDDALSEIKHYMDE